MQGNTHLCILMLQIAAHRAFPPLQFEKTAYNETLANVHDDGDGGAKLPSEPGYGASPAAA